MNATSGALRLFPFFLALALLSRSHAAAAEIVNFPDSLLSNVVHQWLGIPPADPVTRDDMLDLEQLHLMSAPTNLAGLEYASNLWAFGGMISDQTDLAALAPLPKLSYLDITSSLEFRDARRLLALTNLQHVDVTYTGITNVEVLAALPLKGLGAGWLNLSNAAIAESLSNLTYLALSNNSIDDVAPISSLSNLTVLLLDNTGITNAYLLTNLHRLANLGLSGIKTRDCSFVSNFVDLIELRLGGNGLSDISCLSGLTRLNYLFIYGNQLTDLGVITNLPLHGLIASFNRLTNLPPAMTTKPGPGSLRDIDLGYNFLDLHPGSAARGIIDAFKQAGASVQDSPQAMPGNVRMALAARDAETLTLRLETDRPMTFMLEQTPDFQGWSPLQAITNTTTIVVPATASYGQANFFRAAPLFLPVP